MSSLIRKVVFALFFAALISLPGYTFAEGADKAADKEDEQAAKVVVLRVNGVEFTRSSLDTAIANLMPSASFHSSVSQERREKIRKSAVTSMVNDELVREAAAKDNDIVSSITKKDVEHEVDALVKKIPAGRTLKDVLKESRMSKTEMKDYLRKKLQARKYITKQMEGFAKQAEATVDDAFMRDYYAKHLAKFLEPPQMRMRTILIKADPSGGTKVWNAVRLKVKGLVDRARKGTDFAAMAKKYSEDKQTAEKGGDMGWQHLGSFIDEINAVAESMKVGDVSEPIMTLHGYIVVKLEDKKPEVQRKFEELNIARLKAELAEKERKRLAGQWIEDLRAAAKIEYLTEDVIFKK